MPVHLKILLFLMGTTISTGHVLINRTPSRSWNPEANLILMSPKLSYLPSLPVEPTDLSAGLSSSSHFWPLNTNLLYNPRIIMTSDGTPFSTEIRQKDCDKHKESITFSTDKTLEPIEIKPVPERTQELPVPNMVEELSQHSLIMENINHKEPLVIPQAPELPSLHMPEIPASSLMELEPPSEPEVPTVPFIVEFKPIDMPKAPELPSFVMPEITFIEEVHQIPEISPIQVTTLPQIPPFIVSEVSKTTETEQEPITESVHSAPFRPKDTESEPLNIPAPPELPPVVLPELPAPVHVELISSHSFEEPKLPEEVEIISEFRPFDAPSSPGFIPLNLPEPPFISSYSPVNSPECKELEMNLESTHIQLAAAPGLNIPSAPELPPVVLPELPVPVHIEIIPSHSIAEPNLPEEEEIITEFKPSDTPSSPGFIPLNLPEPPIVSSYSPVKTPECKELEMNPELTHIQLPAAPELNIPTAPELSPLVLPELPVPVHAEITLSHSIAEPKLPEEVEIISEFRPFDAPSSSGFIPLNLPEPPFISSYSPVKSPECKESEMNPEVTHIELSDDPVLNIPTAPELPPVVLPELPAPVHTEIIRSYSIAEPKLPEVEIISEFRPFDAPSSAGFIPQNLPELPFISTYSPVISPDRKEFDMNTILKHIQIPAAPELLPCSIPDTSNNVVESPASESQPLRVNIQAAPGLPPLSLPELLSPIEFTPNQSEDASAKGSPRVNIPAAPSLPPLSIMEQPGPIKILEEISTPEINPIKIHTSPKLPLLPAADKTEPIIVKVPATSNSEEPCKKEEENQPAFISQALQRPMMYPVFLAQNIIIERVVPNLYLSHKPHRLMDRPDSAGSASHPGFSNDNVESEMYKLISY